MNPTDKYLAFCGDCGAPLDALTGAGFSIRPYVIAVVILAATTAAAVGVVELLSLDWRLS